ncbi:MAG TPA: Nramp family divalent metal transporter [Firmicutes bacterium]|nr:Nramp family divalent metal transporter [Bacillota bacterium]
MSRQPLEIQQPPRGWSMLLMVGPGIVWTGMAIGGGELVLNPRVGAIFGITTLWMPLLAIALKWFMVNEIGRWSIYTGTSIREGLALLPGPRKWLSWIILLSGLYLGAVHIGGLVAMVGVITSTILPFLPPYAWAVIMMLSYVLLTWSGRYSLVERIMMACVAMLTITTAFITFRIFPGWGAILDGFRFIVPTSTPEWAVENFKISPNPLVEILPAMAFAGAGAINSLWYSDWVLAKGFASAGYYNLGSSSFDLAQLKELGRNEVDKLRGWYRVMFHDALWGGNVLTLVVTGFFVLNATVILHPLHLAPAGVNFIMTLSKTFTEVLGPGAKWLYLIGAWAVIYSTMATVYDGYARLIDNSIKICLPNWRQYLSIPLLWRYRIWVLYGTLTNFVLVYMFSAIPVGFLQAASWVEGTYLLPIVAFGIAYLTRVILPRLYPPEMADKVRPHWAMTAGTVAAGMFYLILIIYALIL